MYSPFVRSLALLWVEVGQGGNAGVVCIVQKYFLFENSIDLCTFETYGEGARKVEPELQKDREK